MRCTGLKVNRRKSLAASVPWNISACLHAWLLQLAGRRWKDAVKRGGGGIGKEIHASELPQDGVRIKTAMEQINASNDRPPIQHPTNTVPVAEAINAALAAETDVFLLLPLLQFCCCHCRCCVQSCCPCSRCSSCPCCCCPACPCCCCLSLYCSCPCCCCLSLYCSCPCFCCSLQNSSLSRYQRPDRFEGSRY